MINGKVVSFSASYPKNVTRIPDVISAILIMIF